LQFIQIQLYTRTQQKSKYQTSDTEIKDKSKDVRSFHSPLKIKTAERISLSSFFIVSQQQGAARPELKNA